MNDEIKQIATRVVDRLLGEDYASHEEFEKRPGGPRDPLRQTTMKMKFKKKDFTGKRPSPVEKGEEEKEEKPSRFNLKFGECKSAMGTAGKAWKKGKKMSGQAVAGKPGKVSYREALMATVLEKLKMKKAAKGNVVAKKPGKVSYRKEGFELVPGARAATGGPGQPENWDAFWQQAKEEASDPNDLDYLETLLYYLQLSDNAKFKGIRAQQLPEVVAQISPEEWAQIGENNPLRQQWEQQQNGGPEPEAPMDEPEDQPEAPRDQPPHVESRMAEGKKSGMKGIGRAKKMLGTVAKKPGSVGYGKK